MPPKFYNLADQKLFEKYQYLPQEKYRLGLNLPTDATEDEVVTDQGIVNTNAFAGSGGDGFSSTGNMFGEGTAVSPVYGSTPITGGLGEPGTGVDPVTGDIVGGGNIVDEFGTLGEVYPAGTFDNLESEEEVKQNFFSKLFNKAGEVKAGLPAALKGMVSILNPLSIVPTILGNIGGDGPKYGIAGLTDQQKNLYDSFAATGNLFQTPSGYKTFDGKNFSAIAKDPQAYVDKYFDSQINQIDPETGKPFGSISAYKDYLDKGGKKKDPTTVEYLLKQYNIMEDIKNNLEDEDDTIKNSNITPELINEFLENNNTTDTPVDTPVTQNNSPGYPGPPTTNYNPNVEVTGPDYGPYGDGNGGQQNNNGGQSDSQQGADNAQNEANQESAGAGGYRKGGRVKYFYGGKV